MADWDQLREMTQRVVPPDFDSLARAAHRQQKRRAAITVGTLAGLVLVGGGIVASTAGDGDGTIAPAQDPSTSDHGSPATVQALPEPDPGETSVDLAAGRYRVPLDDTLAFEVDLPEGTTAHDDGLFLATASFVLKTELAGDEYGVPGDPCTDHHIVPVGPTVDDLVRALTRLPAYHVSAPEPVRLGGARGTYLEARVPRSYHDGNCEGGAVELPGNPGTSVGGPAPYVGRWWVLDVDGQRVVVQQNCWGCSETQFERAPKTSQSITFTPTD